MMPPVSDIPQALPRTAVPMGGPQPGGGQDYYDADYTVVDDDQK